MHVLKKISFLSIIVCIISIFSLLVLSIQFGDNHHFGRISAIVIAVSFITYLLSALLRGAIEALDSMKKPTSEQLQSQYYLKRKKIDLIYDWIVVLSTIFFWAPIIIVFLSNDLGNIGFGV